jgi:hypothetical protein
MKHEWVIDRKNEIKMLARLYQNKKAAFREVVTNSIDQYEVLYENLRKSGMSDENLPKKIIDITMPDKEGNSQYSLLDFIRVIDYATGIENVEQFRKALESDKKDDDITAGEFGIGRASMLALTKNCEGTLIYITNNGDIEQIILINWKGFDEHIPVSSAKGELRRQGVSVTITDLDMDALPSVKSVINYLSGVFGLRILYDKNLIIRVNGETVPVNKEIAKEYGGLFRKKFKYAESDLVLIEGNVNHFTTGDGTLTLYKKFIRIGNNPKDIGLGYRIKGWINCDQFELTPDRDNVKEDEIYKIITTSMDEFCANAKFPRIERTDVEDASSSKKAKKMMESLSNLMNLLVSDLSFKDRLALPTISVQKEIEITNPFNHPEIAQSINKMRIQLEMMDNPSLSGSVAGEGNDIEGFVADGHEHPITTGSGLGIHTSHTVKSDGDAKSLSEPANPTIPKKDKDDVKKPEDKNKVNDEKIKSKQTVQRPGSFEFIKMSLGDSKPPIFVKDNRIVLNVTNTIFKICNKQPLAYVQLFSIAIAHLFKDYPEVDQNQRDIYIYQLMLHNMTHLGLVK